MDFLAGYSPFELTALALGLLATGIAAGLLAGLLGVGGGIVIVPVLFHIFTAMGVEEDIRMHLAVGTSLGTIVPTSIRSVRAHWKKGVVDMALLKAWAIPVLAGVTLGTLLAAHISSPFLTGVFAAIALIVAVHLAVDTQGWRLGDTLPSRSRQSAIATGIGCLSAMMGIGGGTFGVMSMTLYGRPIHQAVGTSAGLGVLISIPGVLGFAVAGFGQPSLPPFTLGYVHLVGVALIVPLTVFAAPWGAALAHKISRKALMRAFAFFLLLTSVRLFHDLLGNGLSG